MTLDSYFNETSPEKYRFLGFYEYRQKQDDFTFCFQKEALRLQRSLDYLLENTYSKDIKRKVESLKKSFEGHRNHCKDVGVFWDKIENDLADVAIKCKEKELRLSEIDAACSVMQNTTTVLQTAIGRVDTTLSDATCYTPTPVRQNLPLELSEDKDNPLSFYESPPVHKQLEPSLFTRKHDREPEDDEDTEEEYDADQTIIGGGNVSWIVNGLDIRKKLTEYQLERNLPKTKPEYYDVIFFNAKDRNGFLETLEKGTVQQMLQDISEEEKEMPNEQDIKSLLSKIIVRDINKAKSTLQQYKKHNNSFERDFTLNFIDHMIKLVEGTNLLLEPISEGTYIVSVLGPILDQIFIKHKENWRAKYGETCLKASAKECNAQKEDDSRRSPGKKIDTIITLKEEDEEFSVIEVSGPPLKSDWNHFKGDRMKIIKMMKTLMNRLAELRPNSNIRLLRLYAMQSYLNQLTIYEFRLKYAEVYTMVEVLKIPFPKSWKDMKKSYEIVTGLLKYERLLSESSESIQDFLWSDDNESKTCQKMTTRIIYSPTKKKARTC